MKKLIGFMFLFFVCLIFSGEASAESAVVATSFWSLLWTWLVANKEVFITFFAVDILGYFIAKSKSTNAISIMSFIKDMVVKLIKK